MSKSQYWVMGKVNRGSGPGSEREEKKGGKREYLVGAREIK